MNSTFPNSQHRELEDKARSLLARRGDSVETAKRAVRNLLQWTFAFAVVAGLILILASIRAAFS